MPTDPRKVIGMLRGPVDLSSYKFKMEARMMKKNWDKLMIESCALSFPIIQAGQPVTIGENGPRGAAGTVVQPNEAEYAQLLDSNKQRLVL
jgi:hypothetical protein